MKLFVYKTLIAVIGLYILFEFTIGSRIDFYTDKIKSLNNQQTRAELKQKILIEMEKGSEKENYFSKNEKDVISKFIDKIVKELKVNSN